MPLQQCQPIRQAAVVDRQSENQGLCSPCGSPARRHRRITSLVGLLWVNLPICRYAGNAAGAHLRPIRRSAAFSQRVAPARGSSRAANRRTTAVCVAGGGGDLCSPASSSSWVGPRLTLRRRREWEFARRGNAPPPRPRRGPLSSRTAAVAAVVLAVPPPARAPGHVTPQARGDLRHQFLEGGASPGRPGGWWRGRWRRPPRRPHESGPAVAATPARRAASRPPG